MRALNFNSKPLPICPKLPFCHSTSSPRSPFNLFNNSHRVPSKTLISKSLRHVRFIVPSSSSSSSSMATSSSQTEEDQKPFAVLFVCLGNICRSPAAEAVFRDMVRKRGLESRFKIDSCGTIGYHELYISAMAMKGNPADSRMRAASKRRGVEVTSISRPLRPSDFREFDLILVMDMQNRDDVLSAYERWSFKESLPANAHKKTACSKFLRMPTRYYGYDKPLSCHSSLNQVKLLCSYCKKHKETEVPDPYYGGPQGFEKVLDLLEDACGELLDNIVSENSHFTAP